MQDVLIEFQHQWGELWTSWRELDADTYPLNPISTEVTMQAKIVPVIVSLLNDEQGEEVLFALAREIRDRSVGHTLNLRAVIDVSNVCGVECVYCPMRRSAQKKLTRSRATADQIVSAAELAYQSGLRSLFVQSGEDPKIITVVAEALSAIRRQHDDWREIILNLGNLKFEQYQMLKKLATGYLIKHETSNPNLHLAYRGETLQERITYLLSARRAGFEVGSGIILGLPQQTDEDLAGDLIFLGRLGGEKMVSCSPFTPSESLDEPFRLHPAGSFKKTKRLIALLRVCFPFARIPATSNLDSARMVLPGQLSGQAEAINAGANGISVQFTPETVEEQYAIYGSRQERHMVYLETAKRVARETGMALGLEEAKIVSAL